MDRPDLCNCDGPAHPWSAGWCPPRTSDEIKKELIKKSAKSITAARAARRTAIAVPRPPLTMPPKGPSGVSRPGTPPSSAKTMVDEIKERIEHDSDLSVSQLDINLDEVDDEICGLIRKEKSGFGITVKDLERLLKNLREARK